MCSADIKMWGISDRHTVWTQLWYSIRPSNAHPVVTLSGTLKRPMGLKGWRAVGKGKYTSLFRTTKPE